MATGDSITGIPYGGVGVSMDRTPVNGIELDRIDSRSINMLFSDPSGAVRVMTIGNNPTNRAAADTTEARAELLVLRERATPRVRQYVDARPGMADTINAARSGLARIRTPQYNQAIADARGEADVRRAAGISNAGTGNS